MKEFLPETQMYEVTTFSHPDTFNWIHASLAYDRVVGIRVNDGTNFEQHGTVSQEHDQRTFEMTERMASGLIIAMGRIANMQHINCNLFSRLLHADYVEEALAKPDGAAWYPVAKYEGTRGKVETLAKGAIGVVNINPRGAVHSLVGLEEDAHLGLQVLSHGAELAMVSHEAMLDFYRANNPGSTVELHLVA